SDSLRERRAVRNLLRAAGQLEYARECLAVVAHEPVGVVLEHEQVPLGRDLGEPAAALEREGSPARVLEGRDRVEEREVALRQLFWDESVLVHGDADDLGAEAGGEPGACRRRGVGGRTSCSARKTKPWSEPLVSTMRPGSTPCRSASHSRSGP